jgi:DNA polymerase III subunit epsilon
LRYIIGDSETTGLSPQARAVELAWIEVDADLNILNEFSSLVDPGIPIEPGAMAIHGITEEMVSTAPTLEELLSEVLPGPFSGSTTLIAHNVKFDRRFFEPIFQIEKTFCSLAFARQCFPEMPNHKLGTVKEYFKLEGGEAHRALGDVKTVHQFLKMALPMTGRSLHAHLNTPATTVFVMPFGLHKGKPLHAIPVEYRTWLLSSDIADDLRQSLMKLREAGI